LLKGDLLYEAKAFKAADEAYRMAARADCPRKGQAWLMAGYAAWQYNDLKASRNAFEKAARFKRHRKDALAAMAQLKRTKQM
jgi:Tfp pilus assembly protein PilF